MNSYHHNMKLAAAVAILGLVLTNYTNATTIGYWRFESDPAPDFGPNFLDDSSGNGLTLTNPNNDAGQSGVATAFSNPIPQTGASNDYHAFTLNANQKLRLADNVLLPTDDFTIEAMVQFGLDVINNNKNADIASQWGGGTNNQWRLLKNTSNNLSMGLSGNGFGFSTTGAAGFTFNALNDYYVAAVVDVEAVGTNVTFYIKDLTNDTPLQVINSVTGGTNPPGPLNNSTSDFVIGGNAVTADLGATRIDEVRLSSGLLAEDDLLIVPEPATCLLALGSFFALIATRRRED